MDQSSDRDGDGLRQPNVRTRWLDIVMVESSHGPLKRLLLHDATIFHWPTPNQDPLARLSGKLAVLYQ